MKHLNLKTMIIIVFMSTLLLNSSCKKDEQHPFVNTEWQIISAKFHADSVLEHPPFPDIPYILGFDDENRYYLSLGHSGCNGKVKFIQVNSLEFRDHWCSLIAEHSKFAAKIMDNIIHIDMYELYNYNKLKLMNEKDITINLEKN